MRRISIFGATGSIGESTLSRVSAVGLRILAMFTGFALVNVEVSHAFQDAGPIELGGHTDNQPIKSEEVLAKFPSNWELSTARATTVVRFLEETCEIPGERLVAAGFSQFRPVAKNSKPKGRAKNRRIEIALLPPRE